MKIRLENMFDRLGKFMSNNKAPLAVLALGTALDAHSTYMCVDKFGLEGEINPVAQYLIDNVGWAKSVMVGKILPALAMIPASELMSTKKAYYIAGAIFGSAAINNYSNLLQ